MGFRPLSRASTHPTILNRNVEFAHARRVLVGIERARIFAREPIGPGQRDVVIRGQAIGLEVAPGIGRFSAGLSLAAHAPPRRVPFLWNRDTFWKSLNGACSYRRTGAHFAGTCARTRTH